MQLYVQSVRHRYQYANYANRTIIIYCWYNCRLHSRVSFARYNVIYYVREKKLNVHVFMTSNETKNSTSRWRSSEANIAMMISRNPRVHSSHVAFTTSVCKKNTKNEISIIILLDFVVYYYGDILKHCTVEHNIISAINFVRFLYRKRIIYVTVVILYIIYCSCR